MIDLVRLGHNISRLREANGYSQEELASKLYVSRQAISAWEVARSAPTIDNVIELSHLFNVSVDELLSLNQIATVDPNHIYEWHDRNYIVKSVIEGTLTVPLANLFYQSTGNERLRLAKAIKEGKLAANKKEIRSICTNEELALISEGEKK